MVFSPPPHWLLCTEPSFDINWVKHEGGREGRQQLDPTVNVTLVSQLHRCQSLAFGFISLFCLCVPLIFVCFSGCGSEGPQTCLFYFADA